MIRAKTIIYNKKINDLFFKDVYYQKSLNSQDIINIKNIIENLPKNETVGVSNNLYLNDFLFNKKLVIFPNHINQVKLFFLRIKKPITAPNCAISMIVQMLR